MDSKAPAVHSNNIINSQFELPGYTLLLPGYQQNTLSCFQDTTRIPSPATRIPTGYPLLLPGYHQDTNRIPSPAYRIPSPATRIPPGYPLLLPGYHQDTLSCFQDTLSCLVPLNNPPPPPPKSLHATTIPFTTTAQDSFSLQ